MKKNMISPLFLFCIIAGILLVLCATLLTIILINKPARKVEKALEKGEYDVVVNLYDTLLPGEMENVNVHIMSHLEDKNELFAKQELSFKDIEDMYSKLSCCYLKDNKEFQDLYKDEKDIAASQSAFYEAEKYYAENDYGSALMHYKLVCKKDIKDYEQAVSRIDNCLEYGGAIVGRWESSFDVSNMFNIKNKECPIKIYFEFDKDANGLIEYDLDSFYDELLVISIESIYEKLYSEGFTQMQADKYFEEQYSMSIEEYAKNKMEEMDISDIDNYSNEFKYKADMDTIYILQNGKKCNRYYKYEVKANKLYITGCDDVEAKGFTDFGIEFPIAFTK